MSEAEQPYLVKRSKGKLHEHSFNIEFGKVLAETEALWDCHDCKSSFKAVRGTMFHRTIILLQEWLLAIVTMENGRHAAITIEQRLQGIGEERIGCYYYNYIAENC